MFVTQPQVAGAMAGQQRPVIGGQPLQSSVGPFNPSPPALNGGFATVPLSSMASMFNNSSGANNLNTTNGSPITMPSTLNTGLLGTNAAAGANTTGGVFGQYSAPIGPEQPSPGIWQSLVNLFGGSGS